MTFLTGFWWCDKERSLSSRCVDNCPPPRHFASSPPAWLVARQEPIATQPQTTMRADKNEGSFALTAALIVVAVLVVAVVVCEHAHPVELALILGERGVGNSPFLRPFTPSFQTKAGDSICNLGYHRSFCVFSRGGGRGRWVDNAILSAPPDLRQDVKTVLEKGERAARNWELTTTRFLNPSLRKAVVDIVRDGGDVPEELAAREWGGYAGAERSKLILGRSDMLETVDLNPQHLVEENQSSKPPLSANLEEESVHGCHYGVAACRIKGNFKFEPTDHRSILGSLMGSGVNRDELGDILILPDQTGALAFTSEQIAPYLQTEITKVGRIPVSIATLPWPKVQELVDAAAQSKLKAGKVVNAVEASLRFDAVASSAFGISRAKVATMIRKGTIQLNWRERQINAEIVEGDIMSARGIGRAQVIEVQELARKNKFSIRLLKFVK